MMSRLREWATADIVVLSMMGIIAFVIITTVIGGVVWRINDPNADIDSLVKWVGDLTSTLIGAVVGYLAGKGSAKKDDVG